MGACQVWEYFQQPFQGVLNILDLWIVMSISIPIICVYSLTCVWFKGFGECRLLLPYCKAKYNYELSTSEKCQPNVKYVYPIYVCMSVCVILFPPVDFFGQLYICLYRLKSLSSGFKPNFVTIFEAGL